MGAIQSRERGGCLTAWLILVLIANALVAFSYIATAPGLQQTYPTIPTTLFLVLGIIGALNVVSAIGLWTWHKWGFYLYAASSIVTFVINVAIGLPILSSLIGLLGVAILWYLLHKKWEAFV